MISSQKDSFLKAYKEGKNFIPIVETWPADLETPLSTWLKLSSKDSHGVFLESVEGGENLGRWSIVATQPLWEAVCYGEEIIKTWNNGKTETYKGDPFDVLRSWTKEYKSIILDLSLESLTNNYLEDIPLSYVFFCRENCILKIFFLPVTF